MITVAPVHCKYGKSPQFYCFYSTAKDMVMWDVNLLFLLASLSSNWKASVNCVGSVMEGFAHAHDVT